MLKNVLQGFTSFGQESYIYQYTVEKAGAVWPWHDHPHRWELGRKEFNKQSSVCAGWCHWWGTETRTRTNPMPPQHCWENSIQLQPQKTPFILYIFFNLIKKLKIFLYKRLGAALLFVPKTTPSPGRNHFSQYQMGTWEPWQSSN